MDSALLRYPPLNTILNLSIGLNVVANFIYVIYRHTI